MGSAGLLRQSEVRDRQRPGRNQSILENSKYSTPESIIAAGNVSTQASAMLRIVDHCNPDPLAAMVPAIPDESTWVVETGNPRMSAAAIVAAAVISAQAPCA